MLSNAIAKWLFAKMSWRKKVFGTHSTPCKISFCTFNSLAECKVKSLYVKPHQLHYRDRWRTLALLYLMSSESYCAYARLLSLSRSLALRELCFLILWGALKGDEIKYLILVGRNKTNNSEHGLEKLFHVPLTVNTNPSNWYFPLNFPMALPLSACFSVAKSEGTQ